jgi:hypothetical protein
VMLFVTAVFLIGFGAGAQNASRVSVMSLAVGITSTFGFQAGRIRPTATLDDSAKRIPPLASPQLPPDRVNDGGSWPMIRMAATGQAGDNPTRISRPAPPSPLQPACS